MHKVVTYRPSTGFIVERTDGVITLVAFGYNRLDALKQLNTAREYDRYAR